MTKDAARRQPDEQSSAATDWQVERDRVAQSSSAQPVDPPGAEGSVLDLPEAAFQSASAALSAPPATPGADLRAALEKLKDELGVKAYESNEEGRRINRTVHHETDAEDRCYARAQASVWVIERLAALLDAQNQIEGNRL